MSYYCGQISSLRTVVLVFLVSISMGFARNDDGDFLASIGIGPESSEQPKPVCNTENGSDLSDSDFLNALINGCSEEPEEAPRVTEESTVRCQGGKFQCTPYHRCNQQDIVSDGLGAFDLRILTSQFEEEMGQITHSDCMRYGDVCCKKPQSHSEPEDTDDLAYLFRPQCGRRNVNGVRARITGFSDNQSAQFGEFPWMAAVLNLETDEQSGAVTNRFVAGGSLVHPQAVLTSAHNIREAADTSRLVVRLGEWDTNNPVEALAHAEIAVARVIEHPTFTPRQLIDDVTLLLLSRPVRLQQHIDTICLPSGAGEYSDCVATGWGVDRFNDGGEYQTVLKSVPLDLVPREPCQTALQKTSLSKYFYLDESFICALGQNGRDTCSGDGGSPLVCKESSGNDTRYVQMGIVSWGVGCAMEGVPGVYTDVRRHFDWIQQEIDKFVD